jgi:lysophospholipase L1-like esterase
LYCQDAATKGKKMNRREGETDDLLNDEENMQRGIVWDTTLAAVNAWAGFWRGREYNKMLKKRPEPRIVSEGDSWFQHPLLNDIIDNVAKFYPVNCLASAGDTIANYLKTGKFATEIATVKPVIFLLSGGGNDILGESMRDFLVKNAPAAAPGTQPERFLNEKFEAALSNLEELYRTVFVLLKQQSPDLHIIVHGYDYPIPNPVNSKKGWLGPYLDEFDIKDPADRSAISHYMMDSFNQRLLATSGPFEKVHYLDLRNIVQPGEWHDEIHPTDEGYQRVSLRFLQKIASLLENATSV